MAERNELIAYALDFTSYLVSKMEDNAINRVILHGSITRGDFDEKSDIDLFIGADKKMEKKIKGILESYHKTVNFRQWELKGVKKEFSIIVGNIDSNEWKGLKRAIMNTGIVLYGKYKAEAESIRQYVLFSFESIKPDKKRVAIFRKLFGFVVGKKKYIGLAERIGAIKSGKGCLLVPVEHAQGLQTYFRQKKVAVRLLDVWLD